MKKETRAGLIVIAIMASVMMFSGCLEKDIPASSPTASPIVGSLIEDSKSGVGSPTLGLGLINAWWLPKWSDDGANLNLRYTRGKGTMSQTTQNERQYNSFGVQVGGDVVIHRKGEDIYGREQDMIIRTLSSWRGSVKPDSVAASGTITYPNEVGVGQSWFNRSLKVMVIPEYNEKGEIKGGSGTESFSGHILTSAGKVTYSGSATGTFTVSYGKLHWTQRIEETTYYLGDKPYAVTVTVIIPESQMLGGNLLPIREHTKTTTTCADGSRRESDVVILWPRNENGVLTGKSGSGVVTGTEVINGKPVNYTGLVTIDYGFDSKEGWHKVGYNEKRSADTGLPNRLPFEVIYIDDLYMRPVF
jgi:hypothetical protein